MGLKIDCDRLKLSHKKHTGFRYMLTILILHGLGQSANMTMLNIVINADAVAYNKSAMRDHKHHSI